MNVPLAFAILLGVLVLSTAEPSSFCRLDLGLVVDTTKSVRSHNVPKLIASIKDLLGNLTISSSETHVSLETFSFEGTLHNQFKDEAFHSQEAMFDLVDNSIGQLRSPTRLDLAINLAYKSMFPEESGDRVGVPSVMLIFTDGRSKPNKTQDFGEQLMALRMRGVIIIAVAVGPDSKKQQYQQVLESIAGKNVFYSDDYLIPYGELRELICPPSVCNGIQGLDLAFLIDKTKSIKLPNFQLLKGFVQQISESLDIRPDGTRVAFILFAKQAAVLNTFSDTQYHDKVAVLDLIKNIPEDLESATYIDRALIAASNSLFTVAGGERPGYPNVLVLFTDGKTNVNSMPFSSIIPSLEEKNVTRITVGIGNYMDFYSQLVEIASSQNSTFTASNFVDVFDLLKGILEMACGTAVES